MKKLLAVLAVVALVAISFTSCNNGTPAPSTTIPEAVYGSWEATTGDTIEVDGTKFVVTSLGNPVDYATYANREVNGNEITFTQGEIPSGAKFTLNEAGNVITGVLITGGQEGIPVTYTKVKVTE